MGLSWASAVKAASLPTTFITTSRCSREGVILLSPSECRRLWFPAACAAWLGAGPERVWGCSAGKPRQGKPRHDALVHPSIQREDPDRAAFGNGLFPPGQAFHLALDPLRIDAPAGHHRDVLLATDGEAAGRRDDARRGRELPQQLAALGVVGAEHAVIGATGKQHAAAGGEDRAPVPRVRVLLAPDLLAAIDAPGLDAADVVETGLDREVELVDVHPSRPLARHDRLDHTGQREAMVVVVGHVQHAGLGVVGLVRPVLATPQAGAVGARLAGV